MKNEIINVTEATILADCNKKALYDRCHRKQLPKIKIRGRSYFHSNDVINAFKPEVKTKLF